MLLFNINNDLDVCKYSQWSIYDTGDGACYTWNGSNYLSITLSEQLLSVIDKYHIIVFEFSTGSQTTGGTGQIFSHGTFVISSWNGGCPIIEGKHARWNYSSTSHILHIWCDSNPSLPLRSITLVCGL